MRLSKASCNSVSDALIESKPGYSCCIVPLNILLLRCSYSLDNPANYSGNLEKYLNGQAYDGRPSHSAWPLISKLKSFSTIHYHLILLRQGGIGLLCALNAYDFN